MQYEKWKNWRSQDFLRYTRAESEYFGRLMSKFDVKPGSKLLEIGFGNGGLLGYAIDSGFAVSGIESNPELTARAIENGVDCFESLASVESNSIDLVLLFDVLEHITHEEIPNFLAELARILKPTGQAIIRTPNGHSPLGLSNQHGDITHKTVITLPKIEFWIAPLSLKVAYGGWDVTPLPLRRPIVLIKTLVRLLLARTIEKIVRLIFRPQPSGLLSANLLICLQRSE
jgi:SAM-dependent methyltransferase